MSVFKAVHDENRVPVSEQEIQNYYDMQKNWQLKKQIRLNEIISVTAVWNDSIHANSKLIHTGLEAKQAKNTIKRVMVCSFQQFMLIIKC